MKSHVQYTHLILTEIETGRQVSQRSLARRIGIALGLTNLLLRRLVRRGCVRVVKIRSNRLRYVLTPRGISEKAKISREYYRSSVQFYAQTRDRIRARFDLLTHECAAHDGQNRIVFFGTGEVAEIGFICLQEVDLQLVGAIDDHGRERFFDVPVYQVDALSGRRLEDIAFDRLVVMSFDDTEAIRAQLGRLGLPAETVFWI